MKNWEKKLFLGACAVTLALLPAGSAYAQQGTEVKAKAPMFSYISEWGVGREKFKELEGSLGQGREVVAKHLSSGDLVGFGTDTTIVHREGESTHDVWWSSTSWAGLMKTLESIRAASNPGTAVLNGAKHHDNIYVSRYYNWKAGSFTNGYTRVAVWKLKNSAPDDAVEQLAKGFAVPMFEKLLANGDIYEYEIDEEAIHHEDPAIFMILYIANGPEGLDKASKALAENAKTNPFAVSAFGSWVESSAHRDGLYWTTATYK